MVPQLDDNVRLTIEEYRSKLYQYIKTKPLNRPAKSSTAQQHTQNSKSESYLRSNSNTSNVSTNEKIPYHQQKTLSNQEEFNSNSNSNINSELIEHYNQKTLQQNAVNSQQPTTVYNHYDSKSNNDMNYQSDDNSTTPTPHTPPKQQHQQNSSSSHYTQHQQYTSATPGVSSSGYSRKKHPSDYQSTTQPTTNSNGNSNLLGGIGYSSNLQTN